MKTYTLKSDGVLKRYDYLWRLTSDRWAWEYLRRNPVFLEDARSRRADDIAERRACDDRIRIIRPRREQTLAQRWGLVLMPDPDLDALQADVIWQQDVFPDQFEVHVSPRPPGETCSIFDRTVPVFDITHVTDREGREALLLRGNGGVIQVRCTGLSLLSLEPVRMKLQVGDVDAYESRMRTYREAMATYGPDPAAQTPLWTKRTQILRDGLIALDCQALGFSRKEIACVLYGRDAAEEAWRSGSAHMKDSVRYLVRKARGLRDRGYLLDLLGARLETMNPLLG
ncbi:DNA -binding domain-containing protein [Henriciella aquimarina]|uniref:DNA -binding domain-containing protein n=1 Tax=Henriciella aquimarina TaxID=545261 RepID=UPI001301C189|nr:DUF2285 domain-containing protein [Henriciella aquimarina]